MLAILSISLPSRLPVPTADLAHLPFDSFRERNSSEQVLLLPPPASDKTLRASCCQDFSYMMKLHISDGLRCLPSLNTCSATSSGVAEATQQDHVHKNKENTPKPTSDSTVSGMRNRILSPKYTVTLQLGGSFKSFFKPWSKLEA